MDSSVLTPEQLALARVDRAHEVDRLLRQLFAESGAGDRMALVAVGGYGRRELSPHSDLDVVLLHDPALSEEQVAEVAERIWYPLWERNFALDHSVRDTRQMREAALHDYRAAMGMLDARSVAGESALVLALRSEVLSDWRRDAKARVAEVRDARLARIERSGWLAHAAIPDLKESGGGLRDSVTLRALVATWLVDVPHGEVESLRSQLLDVRDALHTVAGKRLDRLDMSLIPDVAAVLGRHPEELDLHTRGLGRRLAHLSQLAWDRVDDVLAPKPAVKTTSTGPVVVPLADGVGMLGDEVIVTRDADPATDPEVALRAAAEAAKLGMPIGSSTASHLARTLGDLPNPWPETTRRALVDLLTAGPGLIPIWDEFDFAGVVDRWLPEWSAIRLRGSSSPVHQYTVDRHSLETCVKAAGLRREVSRPDLLAVGALLHDIGKGVPGDHSEVGEPMAEVIALRWGFPPDDARTIARLVRWHLLLPNIATRRDIEDPSTAENVAEIVETTDFLDLLSALTESDAKATGPSAWTDWRKGLVRGLTHKVEQSLAGAETSDVDYEGWPSHVPLPDFDVGSLDNLRINVQNHQDGSLLTVVTLDRPGLMARIAGGLALMGLQVRSARIVTQGLAAASLWEVTRADLDVARVRDRLRSALDDAEGLGRRLALSPTHDEVPPRVRALEGRSSSATVLEVRASDRRGLVWAVTDAIAGLGHSIRSAHLSTYGAEARDVFYVTREDGAVLGSEDVERLRIAVLAALT